MKKSPEYIFLIRCCRAVDYFNALEACSLFWPAARIICLCQPDLNSDLKKREIIDTIIEIPTGNINQESIERILPQLANYADKALLVIPTGPRVKSQFKNIVELISSIKPACGAMFLNDRGELQWAVKRSSLSSSIIKVLIKTKVFSLLRKILSIKKDRITLIAPGLNSSESLVALSKELDNQKQQYSFQAPGCFPRSEIKTELVFDLDSFKGFREVLRSKYIYLDKYYPDFIPFNKDQVIIDLGSSGYFSKIRQPFAAAIKKLGPKAPALIIPCSSSFQQKVVSAFTMLPAENIPVSKDVRDCLVAEECETALLDQILEGRRLIFLTLERYISPQGRMSVSRNELTSLNNLLKRNNALLAMRMPFQEGLETINGFSNIVALDFSRFPHDLTLLKKAEVIVADHGRATIDALKHKKKVVGLFFNRHSLEKSYSFLFNLESSFPGRVVGTVEELTSALDEIFTPDFSFSEIYKIQAELNNETINLPKLTSIQEQFDVPGD